jgi:redox-sensing transcriptional repressor
LRKDLTYFGNFGTRGLGYNVDALSATLTEVLGTTHLQPVILVGAGNLGSALLRYPGFAKEGFEVVAAFDLEATKTRAKALGVQVLPMTQLGEFVHARRIKMAILTVPATVAQEVTNVLVEAGVLAILNFAPIILQVPDNVVVNNVDLAIELENLSYFIQ